MPGSSSDARPIQYLGALVALTGLLGYAVFGWGFGDSSTTPPVAIGALAAAVAVVWTLYRRRRDRP